MDSYDQRKPNRYTAIVGTICDETNVALVMEQHNSSGRMHRPMTTGSVNGHGNAASNTSVACAQQDDTDTLLVYHLQD